MQTEQFSCKSRVSRALAVFVSIAALIGVLSVPVRASDDGADLVNLMAKFQRFMHKAGNALHADNLQLADFYLHEVEEVLEEVEEIRAYDNHPIGEMAQRIFEPALEQLEDAVDTGNQQTALTAYNAAIDKCNECHKSTHHGYIVIEYRGEELPLQNFSAQ